MECTPQPTTSVYKCSGCWQTKICPTSVERIFLQVYWCEARGEELFVEITGRTPFHWMWWKEILYRMEMISTRERWCSVTRFIPLSCQIVLQPHKITMMPWTKIKSFCTTLSLPSMVTGWTQDVDLVAFTRKRGSDLKDAAHPSSVHSRKWRKQEKGKLCNSSYYWDFFSGSDHDVTTLWHWEIFSSSLGY